MDNRTFSLPSDVLAKELILMPEKEFCPWQYVGCVIQGPMMLIPDLGHPGFKSTGQRAEVLILSSQACGVGGSVSHQATPIFFFWAQIPDVPRGCLWLHFVKTPPLRCLASFILSGTAAAASQPAAPVWDASGNSWNSPKGWFYTTEFGTKYFPFCGKYGK